MGFRLLGFGSGLLGLLRKEFVVESSRSSWTRLRPLQLLSSKGGLGLRVQALGLANSFSP